MNVKWKIALLAILKCVKRYCVNWSLKRHGNTNCTEMVFSSCISIWEKKSFSIWILQNWIIWLCLIYFFYPCDVLTYLCHHQLLCNGSRNVRQHMNIHVLICFSHYIMYWRCCGLFYYSENCWDLWPNKSNGYESFKTVNVMKLKAIFFAKIPSVREKQQLRAVLDAKDWVLLDQDAG